MKKWNANSHKLKVPASFEMPNIDNHTMNIVINDINNNRITINGMPTTEFPNSIVDNLTFLLYIYYKTDKVGEELVNLIVPILRDNLPNVLSLVADGHKYLHIDCCSKSIQTKKI